MYIQHLMHRTDQCKFESLFADSAAKDHLELRMDKALSPKSHSHFLSGPQTAFESRDQVTKCLAASTLAKRQP